MPALKVIEHQIIHKYPFSYCAHPFITTLPDGEWVHGVQPFGAAALPAAPTQRPPLLQCTGAFA